MPAYLNTFLKHCSFVFAPTAGMDQYLAKVCQVPKERIGVLPTGLQKGHFQVAKEESDALRAKYDAVNKPLFLTVSRMSHEKNVVFLLECLSILKWDYGRDFRMLFVGDGPDREYYEQLAEKLDINDNAIFTGAVPNDEIAPYFRAADAFLFASKTETQGIVVLEAFAGRTPVLAVEASGVSDLVKNGFNGVLSPEDKETYTRMLADFLDGHMDRKALEENAKKSAEEYREEAVALRASHYYNRIVAEFAAQKNRNTSLLLEMR